MNQSYRNPLITIPERKINEIIQSIVNSFPEGTSSKECYILIEACNRWGQANIPVDYWFLDMDEFVGDKTLVKKYNEVTVDIEKAYAQGLKLCFAGSHGLGKSYVCSCILKRVVETGRSALYTTLSDIISIMTSKDEAKDDVRRELIEVDFLVIDEFDPRFMGTSDLAVDLYGRIIEPVIRTRIQNKLPLLLCTNNPKPTSGFQGALKESISSLFSTIQIVPVLGKDHRVTKEK